MADLAPSNTKKNGVKGLARKVNNTLSPERLGGPRTRKREAGRGKGETGRAKRREEWRKERMRFILPGTIGQHSAKACWTGKSPRKHCIKLPWLLLCLFSSSLARATEFAYKSTSRWMLRCMMRTLQPSSIEWSQKSRSPRDRTEWNTTDMSDDRICIIFVTRLRLWSCWFALTGFLHSCEAFEVSKDKVLKNTRDRVKESWFSCATVLKDRLRRRSAQCTCMCISLDIDSPFTEDLLRRNTIQGQLMHSLFTKAKFVYCEY